MDLNKEVFTQLFNKPYTRPRASIRLDPEDYYRIVELAKRYKSSVYRVTRGLVKIGLEQTMGKVEIVWCNHNNACGFYGKKEAVKKHLADLESDSKE